MFISQILHRQGSAAHLFVSELSLNNHGNAWRQRRFFSERRLGSIKTVRYINRSFYFKKSNLQIGSRQDSNPMTLNSSSEEDRNHLSPQSRKPISRSRSAILPIHSRILFLVLDLLTTYLEFIWSFFLIYPYYYPFVMWLFFCLLLLLLLLLLLPLLLYYRRRLNRRLLDYALLVLSLTFILMVCIEVVVLKQHLSVLREEMAYLHSSWLPQLLS